MSNNRISVSSPQNIFFDSQEVDKEDLDTEQSHNNNNSSAIVQNFFGSGILLESPLPNVIFDSDNLNSVQAALLAAGNFDGTGISPTKQTTDSNFGNQLTVELTNSEVFGRYSVKVIIIGLSFEGELQFDRFYFHKNEKQTTKKHYAKILTILFNDFLGNNNCSRTWGGRVLIRETLPFELSRDAISVSQDIQPDIFFRDFKVSDRNLTLFQTLQEAIGPEYDADKLQINTTGKQPPRYLNSGDTTTIIGEKFQATTNNIQAVTLLMGAVKNLDLPIEDWYDWTGDLVVGIYKLQNSVSCPSDIVPDLAIEFDPQSKPIVEVTFNQQELKDIGYVLTDVAQPIDFVFSNSFVSKPGNIEVGAYYIVTVRRSSSNISGDLFLETGYNVIENQRLSVFSSSWVDVVEENLWFQIWSDSAKYASGMAYDYGKGMVEEKTILDQKTGAIVDNESGLYSFNSSGQNINNIGIVSAALYDFQPVQNEKTGNSVFSRQKFVPSFTFVSSSDLSNIRKTTDPLVIGCMSDTNPKENLNVNFFQNLPGLAKGNTFYIVNPETDLLSLRLIGSKIIPDNECLNFEYRIFKTTLCTDGYGDVNGDGYITQEDVNRASLLLGESVHLPSTQQKIIDGYVSTLEILRADVDGDGYVSSMDVELIQQYVNKSINSFPIGTSFNHLEVVVQPSVGRWDGYFDCDGYIRYYDGYSNNYLNPADLSPIELEYFGNPIPSSIDNDNPVVWNAIPFNSVECTVQFQPFWKDYLLSLSSKAKEVPVSFYSQESIVKTECASDAMFNCADREDLPPDCDPGRNDFFVPGNLILGDGTVLARDGSPVKPDMEVAIINLELPLTALSEANIDIFRNFLVDRGDGFTNASLPAAKYYDCTTVQAGDILLNKIRFNVSIQSFVKNIDGYDYIDGYGITVDDIIGVYMDHSTGILRLTSKDNENNPYFRTLVTRIQVIAYLKKSGWNNNIITVSATDLDNLIVNSLISP
jgi:hypothetical protein